LPPNIPEINVTTAFGHQATQTVQNSDIQKSVATVIEQPPTFVCNAVNYIQSSASHLDVAESSLVSTTPFSSESEIPYTTDNSKEIHVIDESKMVTRNSSNGSKRRTRIRRFGSRQNSKTESDSEEDQVTVTLETPRKIKRKTSRCKKASDTEKASESHQTEEVVYVFKIKPGEKNALATENNNDTQSLMPPIQSSSNVSNAIIKTKRKIFSPVDSSDVNEGSLTAVVGQDIDSASDKNEQSETKNPMIPQSPKFARKFEGNKNNATKELSPNIRIMIQKYNQKFERKSNSPHSSGSSSPAWRSPVLDRRVRRQTERYEQIVEEHKEGFKISKSSSEGKLTDDYREKDFVIKTDDLNIVKIYNGVDEATQTCEQNEFPKNVDDNVEEPIDMSSVETVVLRDCEVPTETGTIPKERRKSLDEHHYILNERLDSSPVFEKSSIIPSSPSPSTSVSNPSVTNIKEWLYIENTQEPVVVNMRYDENKPRTPLSERALKIKKAKEAFLKMPFNGSDSGSLNWSYRISVGSAESSSQEDPNHMKNPTMIEDPQSSLEKADESGYVSNCPPMEASKTSRFGLSSIATRLRKVKLKKSKDASKLNTVSQLCRQSLTFDITNSSRLDDPKLCPVRSSLEQVPKSESAHGLPTRFRKQDKSEKIKKSKSLGGLTETNHNK
jgi:hypothetical protein